MADTSKSRVIAGAVPEVDRLPEFHSLPDGTISFDSGLTERAVDVVSTNGSVRVSIDMGPVPALAIQRLAYQSTRPLQAAPPGQEYVDPFLFETGHFESREEYEELSRTAKIKPRTRA